MNLSLPSEQRNVILFFLGIGCIVASLLPKA